MLLADRSSDGEVILDYWVGPVSSRGLYKRETGGSEAEGHTKVEAEGQRDLKMCNGCL